MELLTLVVSKLKLVLYCLLIITTVCSCKSEEFLTGDLYNNFGGGSVVYKNIQDEYWTIENASKLSKKSISIVKPIVIDSTTILFENIIKEKPELLFQNSYSNGGFSVNFVDINGNLIKDLSYAMIINNNDSLLFRSDDPYLNSRLQKTKNTVPMIKDLEFVFDGASIFFHDSINEYKLDSLVFQIKTIIPLNYSGYDYCFRDYKLVNNKNDNGNKTSILYYDSSDKVEYKFSKKIELNKEKSEQLILLVDFFNKAILKK